MILILNNYEMTVNTTNRICICFSATCFDLTVGHHQTLQTIQNMKGIHKNCLTGIEILVLQRSCHAKTRCTNKIHARSMALTDNG